MALRVLSLIYTTGYRGRVDLASEAIRLARELVKATDEPEARGPLALVLLNHAGHPARFDCEGRIVTLDRQDRSRWNARETAEESASCRARSPPNARAASRSKPPVSALHDDAAAAKKTDWSQILAG